MKIVLVSKEYPPSPRSYGIGTYTHETARGLARLGHEVHVICAADEVAGAGMSFQDGVGVIRLLDEEQQGGWKRHLKADLASELAYRRRVAECLDRLTDEDKAEVVEFPGFRGESHVWARGKRRIPMVVRMHGFTGWVDSSWKDRISATRKLQRQFEIEELLAADQITLVANHLRAAVMKRLPETIPVTTVYNSIDVQRWVTTAKGSAEGIGPTDIVFAGSHTQVKGIFDLMDAIELLRHRAAWTGTLHVFGRARSEFSLYVRRKWGATGIPPYIRTHGSVSRDLLPPAYRSAGVCCFPSRIEPFGYTAVEACASGGLVIGTQNTGLAEVIEDGRTGYLIAPGNVEALSLALQRALAMSGDDADRMRKNAQEHVAAVFDSAVILSRLVDVYSELISQRASTDKEARCY